MAKSKELLLLIDSHALIHRAYHAFPPSLTLSSGELVNAVYGFSKLLIDVLHKFDPDYVIAAMDAGGKTVRHEKYGQYKANRSKPDDDLIQQFTLIEKFLEVMDIPVVKIDGFEADDVIGTLDKQFNDEDHNHETIIVTGDRDLFQLVDHNTKVYLAGTTFSKSKLYDADGVEKKMGVRPEYIIDIKALEGDSSDNIPGVAGVGKKGAATMVAELGHLDEIYENLDKVPSRYQKKLPENYEIAKLSQELATIITDVPLNCEFEDGKFGTFSSRELREFFQEMEFNSLLRKLDELIEANEIFEEEPIQIPTDSGQLSLLASASQKAIEEIEQWSGNLNSSEITLHADIDTEKDPLGWEITKLLIWDTKAEEAYQIKLEEINKFIEGLVKQKNPRLNVINAKELIHGLLNAGVESEKLAKIYIYDVNLATYVISQGRSRQDLDGLLAYYKLGYADKLAVKLAKLELATEAHKQEVEEQAKFKRVLDLEIELIPIIVQMERNGIGLDEKLLSEYSDKLESEIEEIEAEIYKDVGHEFNVGSPKQVGEVLFEEKGLPAPKKTKSGNYSTGERILKELIEADPVVGKILKYRELTKLMSTYLKPLPKLQNEETGRVHAVFNQMGAITGRFSSQNPNMQNIPVGESAGIRMRNAFVAEKDSWLVAMDYSQQELRLLAEFSGEKNMLKAFEEGQDIHAVAASDIFEIPLDEVTKDKRRVGKTINFGIVYGISAFGLADRLKIDRKQAGQYIKRYFDRYPKVQAFYDALIEKAKKNGEVGTLYGRKRSAADLSSKNYGLRQATEREVMNFPLQGSAADIIKEAMLKVPAILEKFPAKMILQVHDELIFEYKFAGKKDDLLKDKQFKDFVQKTKSVMLDNKDLKVPLAIGVDLGKKWGSLKEIDLV